MSMRFFISNPRYDSIIWDDKPTDRVDSFEVCKTSLNTTGTTRGNGYTILRDKVKKWADDLEKAFIFGGVLCVVRDMRRTIKEGRFSDDLS